MPQTDLAYASSESFPRGGACSGVRSRWAWPRGRCCWGCPCSRRSNYRCAKEPIPACRYHVLDLVLAVILLEMIHSTRRTHLFGWAESGPLRALSGEVEEWDYPPVDLVLTRAWGLALPKRGLTGCVVCCGRVRGGAGRGGSASGITTQVGTVVLKPTDRSH
jgi:hypothetical protein